MRICLRLMYDGSNYTGFQRQKNSTAIQNIVEDCLKKIHKNYIKTYGASRTDAGVHALDNLLIFDTNKNYNPSKWIDILNFHLPKDIRVYDSYRVKDDFFPLAATSKKTYCYKIDNSKVQSPLIRGYAYHVSQPLNIQKMNLACKLFEGEHDFDLFRNGCKEYETTIRTIYESKIIKNGDLIEYKITGNGFMYNMVRNIVGMLIDIAKGKRDMKDIILAFNKETKIYMSPTAPPHGLTLEKIDFFDEEIYHE